MSCYFQPGNRYEMLINALNSKTKQSVQWIDQSNGIFEITNEWDFFSSLATKPIEDEELLYWAEMVFFLEKNVRHIQRLEKNKYWISVGFNEFEPL